MSAPPPTVAEIREALRLALLGDGHPGAQAMARALLARIPPGSVLVTPESVERLVGDETQPPTGPAPKPHTCDRCPICGGCQMGHIHCRRCECEP